MNRGKLIAAVYQAMGDPLRYYAIGQAILATDDEATILAFFQAAMVQAERNGRLLELAHHELKAEERTAMYQEETEQAKTI